MDAMDAKPKPKKHTLECVITKEDSWAVRLGAFAMWLTFLAVLAALFANAGKPVAASALALIRSFI